VQRAFDSEAMKWAVESWIERAMNFAQRRTQLPTTDSQLVRAVRAGHLQTQTRRERIFAPGALFGPVVL